MPISNKRMSPQFYVNILQVDRLPAVTFKNLKNGNFPCHAPYDSDFPFGYIRSINRLPSSVFCSSVSDARQRLVTSTSSTSIILLVTGCLSTVPVTTLDANLISSSITILWFRYCVSIGFMPVYASFISEKDCRPLFSAAFIANTQSTLAAWELLKFAFRLRTWKSPIQSRLKMA